MVKATVGQKVFFDFLKKNLPEDYVVGYSDKTPSPMHCFLYKVEVESKKVFLGLIDNDEVKHKRVAELKKFPGCRSAEGRHENNDQQLLHIIVMNDEADEILLDLADAFEDTFGLEAEVEDSPKLLAKIRAEREKSMSQP